MKRLLLLTTLLASPAWAQDEPQDEAVQDEVVVVGERFGETTVEGLTSPVTVIDTELDTREAGELASILRTVPSLAVSESGSPAGLTQIRLRGTEANQVVVLVDGVEVGNPLDGAFDFGGLRAGNIARVEVLRGEQSTLYGSDAVGGVVNVLTRDSSEPYWSASAEAGSRGTTELTVNSAVPVGGAVLGLGGNVFTTDGYDISGEGGNDDGAESRSLDLSLRGLDLGPVALTGTYSTTTRTADFDEDADFDGRLDDVDAQQTVSTDIARIAATTDLGPVALRASGSWAETDTDTRAQFSSSTSGRRAQAQLIAKYDDDTHSFTALGEYEDTRYAFRGDPDTPGNDAWSVAGDYRFVCGPLTLTASARHDFNSLFEDATTWRAGAGYALSWEGRLYASVGEGVKEPTLVELFGFFPAGRFTGNPDLRPERSLGFDVGYRQSFRGGSVGVNYYRSELESEISTVFNPDFTSTLVNLERDSEREGVEVEGQYVLGDLRLNASASWLDASEGGAEEIRRPEWQASGTAAWAPTDAVELALWADHTGEQLDIDFATFSNVKLDAFTLVGAKAAYSFGDAEVYVRAENLLDESYEQLVGYASAGRGVFVGLRFGD